jgi:hypothetical protein
MSPSRRARRRAGILGAIALLVGVAAGAGGPDGPERFGPRSGTSITASGFIGSATTAPDTRLQRDIESGQGQRLSRHDSLAGPASVAPPAQAWVRSLAGVLERAGHPERTGKIRKRGPPTASA